MSKYNSKFCIQVQTVKADISCEIGERERFKLRESKPKVSYSMFILNSNSTFMHSLTVLILLVNSTNKRLFIRT